MKSLFALLLSQLLLLLFAPFPLFAAHGVSLNGELKYPPNFERFAYTSEKAHPGGQLVLHSIGAFDKLNPFTLKGIAPAGLGQYVFEPLAVRSLDEPFALYGLVAQDITLAEDRLSMTITLNPKARFSDGSPITAADVKFSLDTLKSEQAHPQYQIYYKDIDRAEVLSTSQVRFFFHRPNRELHLIACELPVLSKAFYSKYPFNPVDGKDNMVKPIGSGPYVVDKVIGSRTIIYKKNPKYWALDHPTRKGLFNFSTVVIKYFKDQDVSLEALKAGDFDFMYINSAKHWARDLTGPRFASGQLVKANLPHHNNAGLQGFIFNTRKVLFQDRRVRKALGLVFDFEWANKTLFFSQYTRNNSYFSNSEYAAQGLPSAEELKLLAPFRKQLPSEVFTQPLQAPTTNSPKDLRQHMREAGRLLREAGWSIKNGHLVDAQNHPFVFEILLVDPAFQRVMAPYVQNLKRLGIAASYRMIDPALFVQRVEKFDFDMIVGGYGQSQSPGNEQRNYWGTAAAKRHGSMNYSGITDSVVDSLVSTVIYAKTQKQLITACRALDRVLWYGYYVVPNWYMPSHRLVYAAKLKHPATLPLYYLPDEWLAAWWIEQ